LWLKYNQITAQIGLVLSHIYKINELHFKIKLIVILIVAHLAAIMSFKITVFELEACGCVPGITNTHVIQLFFIPCNNKSNTTVCKR